MFPGRVRCNDEYREFRERLAPMHQGIQIPASVVTLDQQIWSLNGLPIVVHEAVGRGHDHRSKVPASGIQRPGSLRWLSGAGSVIGREIIRRIKKIIGSRGNTIKEGPRVPKNPFPSDMVKVEIPVR